MAMVRWSPSRMLDYPSPSLGDFFRFPDLFRVPELESGGAAGYSPEVDIWEDANCVHIEADLPGLEAKDVDIRIEGDVLTLAGERKREREERHEGYHTYERNHGSFARSFTLPVSVNRDKIKARYEKGVLNLELPKREAVKAKKIAIEAH